MSLHAMRVSFRKVAAAHAAILLCLSPHTLSAEVRYQHPDLTIVAQGEPLDSVLKSLGREMRIFFTVPSGLNPVVSCNVQSQPIKQALEGLLGEMSYSLEWEAGGERLAGVTIFASNAPALANASPTHNTQNPAGTQASPQPTEAAAGSEPALSVSGGAVSPESQSNAMEPTAEKDVMREEHEARMAEAREAHEAEMALRRAAEEVAQEARMQEETARHEAEMRAYIESQGLEFPE